MEKNRIRPVKAGKSIRMSYPRQKEVLGNAEPDRSPEDSYKWFLKKD